MGCRYDLFHERPSTMQYLLHCGAIGGRTQSSFKVKLNNDKKKRGEVHRVNKLHAYNTK